MSIDFARPGSPGAESFEPANGAGFLVPDAGLKPVASGCRTAVAVAPEDAGDSRFARIALEAFAPAEGNQL